MTARSEATGKRKLAEKRKKLLEGVWGERLETTPIWNRNKNDGFTTIPRPLPHIMHLMDRLAGKGKPVSSTYLALWCRIWDDGCLEIKDKEDLAYEAGFSGQRAIYSLAQRMRILQELGFIKLQRKGGNEFQYVMIVNPFWVINNMEEVDEDSYRAIELRMNEIGAAWPEEVSVKEEDD